MGFTGGVVVLQSLKCIFIINNYRTIKQEGGLVPNQSLYSWHATSPEPEPLVVPVLSHSLWGVGSLGLKAKALRGAALVTRRLSRQVKKSKAE